MLSARQDYIDLPSQQVMELSGRLDGDTGLELEEEGLNHIQSGVRELVLDCSRITYISGAGVQSLLRLAREMQMKEGKLVACDLPKPVRDMFEACGLDLFIRCYASRDEATEALAA